MCENRSTSTAQALGNVTKKPKVLSTCTAALYWDYSSTHNIPKSSKVEIVKVDSGLKCFRFKELAKLAPVYTHKGEPHNTVKLSDHYINSISPITIAK